eukprot:CAMPEP_0197537892 /NCGR_PEP_ID=MMETSP1318-20131121/58169_1 /TAXON_ID=552666 /ORGANISM="Partenskyella glossopodia, Strain RCC365" /LENGTH=490 /DNA_ID=CAMNT_0043096165 /DNA_START=27 /DNA_END=1499 /DNA_ORIENTATION=-
MTKITGTVWEETLDDVSFDIQDFTSIFGEKKKKSRRRRGSAGSATTSGSKLRSNENFNPVVSLLGAKREENISIMLKRFKMTGEDIKKAILDMDDEVVSLDSIPQLAKLIPNDEELQAIENYDGDPSMLSVASKLQFDLSSIPNLTNRLEYCEFRLRFAKAVQKLSEFVQTLKSASEELMASTRLRQVLRVVLTLGNFLNAGTRRGNCYGFQVQVLSRLSTTKSPTQKDITLLKYICQLMMDHFEDACLFTEDLQHVLTASKLDSQFNQSEAAKLRLSLDKLKGQVEIERKKREPFLPRGRTDSAGSAGPPPSPTASGGEENVDFATENKRIRRFACLDEKEIERRIALAKLNEDRFYIIMTQFVHEAEPQLVAEERKLEDAMNSVNEARKYFTDTDCKSDKVEDFFSIWADFAEECKRMIEVIRKQKRAEAEIREREERAKQEAAARAAAASPGSASNKKSKSRFKGFFSRSKKNKDKKSATASPRRRK